MIRITDKSFRYTPSFNTDLRKKFRKIEQERRAAEAERAEAEKAKPVNVRQIKVQK